MVGKDREGIGREDRERGWKGKKLEKKESKGL